MISLHIFLLSIIQGFTEFLPISSSAHLIILPKFLSVKDQGVIFDIAVHLGSLFAILIFFWKDSVSLIKGTILLITLNLRKKESQFLLRLILASIPVILVGLLLRIYKIDTLLRTLELIGWTMIIFGILLYLVDKIGKKNKKIEDWTYKDALIMGCFQALALIPGVSRSGITISGSRFIGYDRYNSIKLSMLMSIPTILASATLISTDLFEVTIDVDIFELIFSFLLAFFTSFLALFVLIKFIYKFHFTPYILYRIFLGLILLWFVYS